MRTEADKAIHELKVFVEFAARMTELNIDLSSIEKREPPEPDIRAANGSGEITAFELVELCSPEIAQLLTVIRKEGNDETRFIRPQIPGEQIINKKLDKNYNTPHPIELLCYTNGRTMTPDDVSIPTLKYCVDQSNNNPFRRIWYMGEEVIELVKVEDRSAVDVHR
ncbi:MAG: hypothetical protein PHC51_08210 [bacterium]|nr:hypothetical protein [bacterium]